MFARKADRHFLSVPLWCVAALVLSGAAVAYAQLSGGKGPPPGKPPEAPATEQRLFPNGLPKMEAMLKEAFEHHPDVLAARSLLRTAEAELRQAEFKAFKDIMEVRSRWEKTDRQRAILKDANPESYRESLSTLAAVEWELAFLLGSRGELAVGSKGPGGKGELARMVPAPDAPVAPAVVEGVIPRGERAKLIKKELDQKFPVTTEATPFTELIAALSEQSGVKFIFDRQTLEDAGFPLDTPIALKLGEVEMGAALQVLEDIHKPLYFVVRDYGIFVTTQSERSSKTVSALDFWKLTEDELRDKLRQQRQEELSEGGGYGGGGGFF